MLQGLLFLLGFLFLVVLFIAQVGIKKWGEYIIAAALCIYLFPVGVIMAYFWLKREKYFRYYKDKPVNFEIVKKELKDEN